MATKPFYIKQGDRLPIISATLYDDAGVAINLTGSTVDFKWRKRGDADSETNSGACVISDANNGVVEYNWASGDTDVAGTFDAEFQITTSSALKMTVPNWENLTLEIVKDLDA